MVDFAAVLADPIKWAEGLSTGEQWLLGLVISVSVPVVLSILSSTVRSFVFGLGRGVASLFRTTAKFPPQRPTRRVIGRDGMLDDIHDALTGGQIGVIAPPATVTGGPGMGKTTVAREYLSRHGAEFHRSKILDAEQPENLLAQIGDLFEGLEGKLRDRAKTALNRIEDDTDRKWLLIYDNAPTPEALKGLIPYAGHVKALITTRAHRWPEARFRVFPADYLTPEDALTLLLDTAGRPGDQDPEARALVEDLGRIPIGLVQAGESLRANPAASFAEYRARLLEFSTERLNFGPSEVDYPMTVVAAISLSLDEAVEEGGEDVAALLSLLPWLAPEGIDAGLVLDVAGMDDERKQALDADIPDAIRVLAGEGARLQAAISALARRSLAREEGAGRDRTVALHRITAQILRARDAGQAEDRRRAAAAVVAASYPGDAVSHLNWDACRRLNPHVAALAAPSAAGADDTPTPPASGAMAFLLNQASLFHQQQAASDIALGYARTALALTIARLGPDHPEAGKGHNSFGGALGDAGQWAEAVVAYREAWRIAEAQGPDYAPLGLGLSNLAWALRGELDAAPPDAAAREARLREMAALERRAYKHDRRLHGALHDRTATRLNNLASTHDALGDRRRARRIAALALATERKILSPDDPSLAITLNNLGGYHLRDRVPDFALPLLEEALEIVEAAFADNPHHPQRIGNAKWLAACRLALPTPDVVGAVALCKTYGLDYDAYARNAQHFRPLP